MGKAKIVEAVGTSSSSLHDGNRLGVLVEATMTEAVVQCFADGITDPDEMRERKLAAREKVKAEYYAAMSRE